MQILMIKDDEACIERALREAQKAGVGVHVSRGGRDGLIEAQTYPFSAIILGMSLPDMDGLRVLQKLREAGVGAPILVVNAENDPGAVFQALALGADDYLSMPFLPGEGIARVQAMVRRLRGHSESVIKVGRLRVDLHSRMASVNETYLTLTGKEYDILECLTLKRNTMVPKEAILEYLYEGKTVPGARIVDVFICRLRRKLAQVLGDEVEIETIRGKGYRLYETRVKSGAVELGEARGANGDGVDMGAMILSGQLEGAGGAVERQDCSGSGSLKRAGQLQLHVLQQAV